MLYYYTRMAKNAILSHHLKLNKITCIVPDDQDVNNVTNQESEKSSNDDDDPPPTKNWYVNKLGMSPI